MDKKLFDKLDALGFTLFVTKEEQEVNSTFAEVVKSSNLRLWEGFPVILANANEKGLFDTDKVMLHLKSPLDKNKFFSLVAMSLALYRVFDLKFSWTNQLFNNLSSEKKAAFSECAGRFRRKDTVNVVGREMSCQRIKTTFENYFRSSKSKLEGVLPVAGEFSLEYALSQVFSPKQKELFLKKLKGENLNKTEKEYFSRVVKKKVMALANVELHSLAKKLLQYNY